MSVALASNLVTYLQEIIKEYGDLPIYFLTPDGILRELDDDYANHTIAPVGPTTFNGEPIPKHTIIHCPLGRGLV